MFKPDGKNFEKVILTRKMSHSGLKGTLEELIHSCTIIIWVASTLHADVNFGRYPYGGYLPNRSAINRRFMPEKGSPEYAELIFKPHKNYRVKEILKYFSHQ